MTIIISSNKLGNGADDLGETLLKNYIYTLTEQAKMPEVMIFLNSGAFVTSKNSDSIMDLRHLAENGTKILTCGSCINYYNLHDELAVGSISNMTEIVGIINSSQNVVSL